MGYPWSTVEAHPANSPVLIPTKNGPQDHSGFVNQHVPEAHSGHWYWNKYYAGNGHVQTVLAGGDYEAEYPVWYGRRLFKWSDGSQNSVDYVLSSKLDKPAQWDEDVRYQPETDLPRLPRRTRYLRPEEIAPLDAPQTHTPLLISVHGLTGGSHENYVRAAICEVQGASPDIECIVINSRGCNRTKVTTPQLFNGLWTEDLRSLVKHVTTHQPERPIYLVGYSLGAAIVANYVGQEGEGVVPQIRAAVAVSAPWDFTLCNTLLDMTFIGHHIYSPQMCNNLKRLVRNNRAELAKNPKFLELESSLKNAKSISDFDDAMTAPLFGFISSSEYYRNASPVNRLQAVRVPLLIISANDDPICVDGSLPYLEAQHNPYVHTVTSTHGGHLGWFQASGPRWYSTVLSKYVSAMVSQTEQSMPFKAAVDTRTRWFRNGRFQMD